ncbi:hypothetical protein FA95DRAFT_872889 [Auriscalpium vulgare]|uniref:Uncharacterized protein n=1 Tax=Auriscalpium vulgare TaxID=40419 RepID=A0ACB8RZU4_9AGAM|nr:hypothetical protein FA95DRAFT_872889 [Auriscalpium vulgare]
MAHCRRMLSCRGRHAVRQPLHNWAVRFKTALLTAFLAHHTIAPSLTVSIGQDLSMSQLPQVFNGAAVVPQPQPAQGSSRASHRNAVASKAHRSVKRSALPAAKSANVWPAVPTHTQPLNRRQRVETLQKTMTQLDAHHEMRQRQARETAALAELRARAEAYDQTVTEMERQLAAYHRDRAAMQSQHQHADHSQAGGLRWGAR